MAKVNSSDVGHDASVLRVSYHHMDTQFYHKDPKNTELGQHSCDCSSAVHVTRVILSGHILHVLQKSLSLP